MKLTEKDLQFIKNKGITLEQIDEQIQNFKTGFPFLDIIKPATIGDGILRINESEKQNFISKYDKSLKNIQVAKFVPASGAASRMFKNLFEFVNNEDNETILSSQELKDKGFSFVFEFFKNLDKFAFYTDFVKILIEKQVDIEKTSIAAIIDLFLSAEGLNYGNLPKGLLKFHDYSEDSRTSMEEHWVEGALYANDKDNVVHLYFTVSPEHKVLFKKLIDEKITSYEKKYGVKYQIDMTEQKPSTDTIAVDLNNEPFRKEDISLLFRPAGHGALIENLNEIDADLIFIKNIDNVVPDHLKNITVEYKKVLAGVLVHYQEKVFSYLHEMEKAGYDISDEKIDEIFEFTEKELCILASDRFQPENRAEQISLLLKRLNRPIRVCGMVKNEGEPGGGPFWATNPDGSVSLQIAESSQIDTKNTEKLEILNQATHFNPVDLVCGVKDFKGNKFNLTDFRDMETGFISEKSQDGKTLKAQELPGLWNGAMSDWITIFMEVPIETFNPVKTINDLLRTQHQ